MANEPKYQIGDRIPKSSFVVRGVMTTSAGSHRYFLQVFDNSVVVSESELENLMAIANQPNITYEQLKRLHR